MFRKARENEEQGNVSSYFSGGIDYSIKNLWNIFISAIFLFQIEDATYAKVGEYSGKRLSF